MAKKEMKKKAIKEEVKSQEVEIDMADIKNEVSELVGKEIKEAMKNKQVDNIAKKEISGEVKEVSASKKETSMDGNISKSAFNDAFHSKKFKSLNIVVKDLHTTTSDDVSDSIPAEDFRSEVARNEAEYGVASRYANIIRTNNSTVTRLKSATDNQASTTAESADLNARDLDIDKYTISISKYTEYYVATSEMVEDAAIDVFGEAAAQFGRSFAKAKDALVFTDATYGLLNVTGTNSVVAGDGDGATFSTLEYNDFVNAMTGIINPDRGRFYMHRSIWGLCLKIKDSDGRPIVWSSTDSATGRVSRSLLGYPVELVEVMPAATSTALDTAFIVFGDLSRYDLALRTEMDIKVLEEGQVTPVSTTYDLGEDDLTAVRARQRFGGAVSIAGAFSVIKTATSS